MAGRRLGDLVAGIADPALAGAVLTIHAGVAELEEIWREAMGRSVAYAFQTPEWHSAWAATIGTAEEVAVRLVHLAAADGRTLMILPLGLHRERGLKILRCLGHVVTDYNAPLIDRGFAETLGSQDLARLWQAILALLPRLDLVWLRRMPAVIEGVANPLIRLPGAYPAETAHAARLPASMASFLAARHGVFFTQKRRLRKRLAERGALAFPVAATREEALPLLRAMARFKSAQWRQTGGRDLFAEAGYLDFYDRLTTTPLLREGLVHVAGLTVAGEIAAAHWGLVFRDRFYLLMTAYDAEAWARYSPGTLLLENLVEGSIAQGLAIFDLTVGDEGYKRHWADHSLTLYEYRAARSMLGALFLAAQTVRRRLKAALPPLRRRFGRKGGS